MGDDSSGETGDETRCQVESGDGARGELVLGLAGRGDDIFLT